MSATNAQLPTTRRVRRAAAPSASSAVAEPAADVPLALGRARARTPRAARARRSRTRSCRRPRSTSHFHGRSFAISVARMRMETIQRRVVRRAQRLERDVDDERAEDDAAEAAGAAEDQHRVDGDQQRRVEVGGEDGRVQRGEERAGEAARPRAATRTRRASAGSRACPSARPRASPRAATATRGRCARSSSEVDGERARRGRRRARRRSTPRDRARGCSPTKWKLSMSAIPFGPPVTS